MNNLTEINAALEALGYETSVAETYVAVNVNGFTVVLTVSEDTLNINCQLAKVTELREDKLATVAFAALDANTRITPYAFALLSADDGADEDVVVLTDSVPLGDFSRSELESAMDSLLAALLESRSVLKLGIE